jgi:hypothetical protein
MNIAYEPLKGTKFVAIKGWTEKQKAKHPDTLFTYRGEVGFVYPQGSHQPLGHAAYAVMVKASAKTSFGMTPAKRFVA